MLARVTNACGIWFSISKNNQHKTKLTLNLNTLTIILNYVVKYRLHFSFTKIVYLRILLMEIGFNTQFKYILSGYKPNIET